MRLWEIWKKEPPNQNMEKDFYWAAYLHDIGKLRLPRSLLNKIAPLSDEEWSLIRMHPTYGQDILDTFGLPQIALWVNDHHQDQNGTGYPGSKPASPVGLCIAIADYLEASTSPNRKYKKPKSFTESVKELQRFGLGRYPDELIDAVQHLNGGVAS